MRRRLSRLALFALAGLVLLVAVAETASGQSGPRLPRELWNEYPLDPVKGETDPALGGVEQPKTPRESPPTRTRAASADGRSLLVPLVAGIGGAAVLLLMAAGAALRVRKDRFRLLASLRHRGTGARPKVRIASGRRAKPRGAGRSTELPPSSSPVLSFAVNLRSPKDPAGRRESTAQWPRIDEVLWHWLRRSWSNMLLYAVVTAGSVALGFLVAYFM
jgi:hypothetical protein